MNTSTEPALRRIAAVGARPGNSSAATDPDRHADHGEAGAPSPLSDAADGYPATVVTVLSSSTRTETFSDGVMAIALTLLVLDLHVPAGRGHLLSELVHAWPAYLAYADSFVTIGVIWLCHHAFFSRIRHVDALLQWGNLALLMTVAFIPFSTSVLSTHLPAGGWDARVATAFYGLVAAVQASTWLVMWAAIRRRPHLFEEGFDAAFARSESRLGWAGVIVFGLCAGIGLLAPLASLSLYVIAIGAYGVTANGLHAFRSTLWHRGETSGSA